MTSCEVYDDASSASSISSVGNWKAVSSMLEERFHHAGVGYEGKLYCFGGNDSVAKVLPSTLVKVSGVHSRRCPSAAPDMRRLCLIPGRVA